MTNEIISPEAIQMVKQEEHIEITRNSKGYNWEYKLLGNVEEQLKRIGAIEVLLKSKFNKEEK